MMKGVCDALDSLGLISTLVELRAAVALALGDNEAEKGWLRGEDVFCGVEYRQDASGGGQTQFLLVDQRRNKGSRRSDLL